MSNFYNLDDQLCIRSAIPLAFLRPFETETFAAAERIDIDIKQTNARLSIPGGPSVRRIGLRYAYDQNTDTLSYRFTLLGINLCITMSGLEDGSRCRIGFSPSHQKLQRLLPSTLSTKSAVEMAICIKLLQKHRALVSLGCVAHEGKGIVLPAFPDTGKTATVLSLCHSHNMQFLADDRAIISPDGQIYSFPIPCTISKGNIRNITGFQLSSQQKWSLEARNLLSHLLPPTILDPTIKVSPQHSFSPPLKLADKAEVDTILLLEKGEGGVRPISREQIFEVLMNLLRYELQWYTHPFAVTYALANNRFSLSSIIHKEEELVRHFVDHARILSVARGSTPDFSKTVATIVGTVKTSSP